VPKKGETFTDGNLTVHVVDADRYGIKMIEVSRKEPEKLPEDGFDA
jgi:CBS domain containing-hemolysin-like protein